MFSKLIEVIRKLFHIKEKAEVDVKETPRLDVDKTIRELLCEIYSGSSLLTHEVNNFSSIDCDELADGGLRIEIYLHRKPYARTSFEVSSRFIF